MSQRATLRRQIVLCGPMGAGKSTVGVRLAAVLGCPFYDLDEEIERRSGDTVAAIFATRGEAAFRRLEAAAAIELLDGASPQVLALGGGTLTSEPVRTRCAAPDVLLIWLRVSPETAAKRLEGPAGASRPLWIDGGLARWKELVERRMADWSTADLVVDVDEQSPDAIVERVLTLLERDAVR